MNTLTTIDRATIEQFYDRLKQQATEHGSACQRCTTPHCCSEPVWTDRCEVEHIISSLTPEQIEELKPKVKAWMEKASASGMLNIDINNKENQASNGVTFSAQWWANVNTPCPLLKDGRCSVYSLRPMACATFFAGRQEPEVCANVTVKRETLEFADEIYSGIMQALYVVHQSKRVDMDHLGVLLYNLLFNNNIKTASHLEAAIEFQFEP